MKQLIHKGVLIPKKPEWRRLHITIKGNRLELTLHQEEMAIAWVKKLGTDYVKDPVFKKNFFHDFSKALHLKEKVSPEDFNFSQIINFVERERRLKISLTREQKRRLAVQRKEVRIANKEKFGYAIVDGEKVEVGNYTVEPSSIFMGRGKHPLRGHWKQGVDKRDITLNLSPDAPKPSGDWMEIKWFPDCMWIAKWNDRLRGKTKYIWLADSSPLKQEKEIEKFDKAKELGEKIQDIRKHIKSNLTTKNITRRKIATVCYLIDAVKLRVGDEKDPDEADTVGATTLRPEHISFGKNRVVTFDFLGKDAVRWQKRIRLPAQVISNITEFMKVAESPMFKEVNSQNVSQFLDEIVPGVSSKTFRTFHSSQTVDDFLNSSQISKNAPEYEKKYTATTANLEAAIICNHKRKPPKNWKESLKKKRLRLKKLRVKNTESAKKRARILQYRIKTIKETKDYNLRTSLKSYIDPRIYYKWGKAVDFDWKLYYPKALLQKFSWVERDTN